MTIVLFFAVFLCTFQYKRADRVLPHEGRCVRCKYSLDGLPDAASCPECGLAASDQRIVKPGRTRLGVRPGFEHAAASSLYAVVAWIFLGWIFAERLVYLSYRVAGYSVDVAATAAKARELRSMSPDEILWPVAIVVVLSPLVQVPFGRGPRGRGWLVLLAWLMSLLGTLAIWTIPYI